MSKAPEEETNVNWVGANFTSEVARRVGDDPRARLRWLTVDFPKFGKDQLEQARLEAAVFILLQNGPGSINMSQPPRVSDKDLLKLIQDLGEGIKAFVDEGRFPTIKVNKPMALDVYRSERTMPPNKGFEAFSSWSREFRISDAESFRLVFLIAAGELLGREGALLARCAFRGCNEFFVQEDLRQKYCSESHANREHQARLRAGETKTK